MVVDDLLGHLWTGSEHYCTVAFLSWRFGLSYRREACDECSYLAQIGNLTRFHCRIYVCLTREIRQSSTGTWKAYFVELATGYLSLGISVEMLSHIRLLLHEPQPVSLVVVCVLFLNGCPTDRRKSGNRLIKNTDSECCWDILWLGDRWNYINNPFVKIYNFGFIIFVDIKNSTSNSEIRVRQLALDKQIYHWKHWNSK